MTYAQAQFKVGSPKARYNAFEDVWNPAVGGAVKYSDCFKTLQEAKAMAESDKSTNSFAMYD